ncbi:MAG TPA: hypothetical protein VFN44_15385 [Solirubrobacteraceae bacterium]|nr:hypothetical protein [Solirubrobacteraceae bacterium]
MPPTRRLAEERPEPRERPPEPAAAEPDLLTLQRTAGNAAVTRMLARDALSNALPADAPLAGAPDLRLHGGLEDWNEAGFRVDAYFDEVAKDHRETLNIPGSMAGLVHQACEQEFTLKNGTKLKVGDKMKPTEVEQRLRLRARTQGFQIQEHAEAGDLPGIKAEMDALLANLGAIPTEVKLGNDDIKVVASISGKVSAEAKAGSVKIEGEGSSEGIEGGVTVGPGKLSFGQKGVKAEIKVGDLIKVSGGLTPEKDGGVGWSASLEIGTIGKLIMPEEVAKVFKGTQETFSKSAGELVKNRDDPAKVKEHGGALVEAVKNAVEKAQKSAAQAKKPGWRVGVDVKGDGSGGVSGSITLTWVF